MKLLIPSSCNSSDPPITTSLLSPVILPQHLILNYLQSSIYPQTFRLCPVINGIPFRDTGHIKCGKI